MKLIGPKELIYLTSAICDETPHWTPEQLDGLGIDYDRRHNYPLTTTESKYIGDGMDGYKGTTVLNGYSVLWNDHKYFAPSIELPFLPPESDKTLEYLREVLLRAEQEGYKAKMQLFGCINEFDGPDEDRHTAILLVPVEIVKNYTGKQYNEWLASFFG